MNRMSGLYGSLTNTSEYSGLTEMFTDPVEEEVSTMVLCPRVSNSVLLLGMEECTQYLIVV